MQALCYVGNGQTTTDREEYADYLLRLSRELLRDAQNQATFLLILVD